MIISGHCYVEPAGKMRKGQSGIDRDENIPAFAEAVRVARKDGSRFLLQLAHGGIMTTSALTGCEPRGPSAHADNPAARAMTREEIFSLTDCFAKAARRALDAGFDGVELHAAHGFLLSQFLSPYYNTRTDDYGGNAENRSRFICDIIRAIRASCGVHFTIGCKVNAHDCVDGGQDLQSALECALFLEKAGVDFLEVSGGICTRPDPQTSAMRKITKEDCYFAPYAAAFKKSLHIPVITVGGIRTAGTAEKLLEEKTADLIGLGRPFICEPDLAEQWRNGLRKYSLCRSCNACVAISHKTSLHCAINRARTPSCPSPETDR